jgi:hypothetical protein
MLGATGNRELSAESERRNGSYIAAAVESSY